jgi:hypothetical protein
VEKKFSCVHGPALCIIKSTLLHVATIKPSKNLTYGILDIMTTKESYNPDNLLSSLISQLNLKNDAALSRALEVAPPMISKIRHRRLPVAASLLIRMHEISALSIKELRELMGDRRDKFRISSKPFKQTQV